MKRRVVWGVLGLVVVLLVLPRFTLPAGEGQVARVVWTENTSIPQLLVERGKDGDAPVLMLLHGGPGISMAAANGVYAPLEDDLLVVLWDQPGSVTACSSDPPTLAGVVADGIAVAEALRTRHNVDRVGVMGSSWGSVVGVRMVQERPDLFWGYMAEGQVVSTRAAEAEAMAELQMVLTDPADRATLDALTASGPPFENPQDVGRMRALLWRHDRVVRRLGPYLGVFARWAVGPEHTVVEKARTLPCVARAAAALGPDIRRWNLLGDDGRIEVPAVILQGRFDYLTGPRTVGAWAEQVGVDVVWFDGSGHVPSLEEPAAFFAAVRAFSQEFGGG